MDEIPELQRIANKEDGRIVSRHVPVAFFGVKLQSKTAWVARRIRRTLLTAHRRKAPERPGLLAHGVEWLGGRVIPDLRTCAHEMPINALTLRVHHPLRESIPVVVRR